MSDAPELLPCPFCGDTMQVTMRDAMLCLTCYAAGPQGEDRKANWNRRADDAAPDAARLAELERQLAEARNKALDEAAAAVETHFPGTLYASNRTKVLAILSALKEPKPC
jgi:hypothetical protein